ncbi:MAG: ArsA family ATPase [Candidatus Jordarchaeaceae archaeon]
MADLVAPKNGTRFSFFSGKGGVGKTTMAASTAVWLADHGYRTLIVSTDLQMSLNDIFQQETVGKEIQIKGVPNLRAKSIETAESLQRHREKMVKTLELIDPGSPIIKMIEMDKNTDCGCAQAALFEFGEYLKNPEGYDAIVFDTAPAGATLEKIMNQTNYAMSLATQLDVKKKLYGALGQRGAEEQIRALEEMKKDEDLAIENLRSEKTSFIMVMYPEAMPLAELERDIPVLETIYKIPVRGIVINNVLPEKERDLSDFWRTRWVMQARYLGITHRKFKDKAIVEVPLLETEAVGVEKLRRIGHALYEEGNEGKPKREVKLWNKNSKSM